MSGTVGDNTARASGVIASAGGGAVLQVKSVQVTAAASIGSSASPVAITALDIAFTPTADNSVLCLQLSMEVSSGTNATVGGYFYDSTGAAKIMPYGDTAGSRDRLTFLNFVHGSHLSTPLTFTAWFTPGDATTRTIQVFGAGNGGNTLYINRCQDTGDYSGIDYARSASTFTITEYDGSIVTVA